MNIEDNIFKRTFVSFDKLILYGFINKNDSYYYSKNILDNNFQVQIIINDKGILSGKIIDLKFNEEYTNFRIKDINGEFSGKVREEYEKLLIDIRDKCFIKKYFIYDQTNRISNLIFDKYDVKPEFPWEDAQGYGVFKNNKKWFAIIMNINKSKITKGNNEVEIINVKLPEEDIKQLLNSSGYYKAYHMNKKNWITIILDDTINDEKIMDYINKSYLLVEKK